jgi:ribose transport system substrate-binding protein
MTARTRSFLRLRRLEAAVHRSIAFVLSLLALLPLLGCGGNSDAPRGVILLRYSPGSESTTQREEGFLDTLKSEYPQVNILSSDQYSGTTEQSSLDKAQQLMLKYGDRVEGIFAVCEPNANGTLKALEEAGLSGKVKFIGFDPNQRMVRALREGKMDGIVLQDPVMMGYQAVKTMAANLEGKTDEIKHRQATGEYVATPDNMDEKRMAELLSPRQFSGAASTPADAKYRIAVIPKGTTHEFWKSIHAGANKAGSELGVSIVWKGPVREDDRDEQVKVVENFIAAGVDGIVLAPLDDTALVPVVKDAVSAGIPVVIIDSDIRWDGRVSFVATDNYEGGAASARRLGGLLEGRGKVAMMRYQEGSASTMERETGFLETLAKDFPAIEIVSDNQYGGATTESAYKTAENLLVKLRELDGVFCPNESTTFGMLRALQDAKRAGEVRFVGFDASDKLVQALGAGEIHGLAVQNPFAMGELGVRTLVAHLDGQTVEARIDTGVQIVTADNMHEESVAALLAPDLAKWLR